jgi:mycothiol S-conjugate amidase
MTTYNDFGGYGHPDHIRTHLVAVGAFSRAGDPAWYPEQLAAEHGGTGVPEAEGGLAPWSPAKLYEQAIPASVRHALQARMEAVGERSFWSPPEDATPEQLVEFEAYAAKMLVPDETVTAWVDVSAQLDQRWEAFRAHATQISDQNPFVRFGRDAWREFWFREAYVRRESRIPAPERETDLFAGLDGLRPGRYGWDGAAIPAGSVGAP